jgi:hypothetical protein
MGETRAPIFRGSFLAGNPRISVARRDVGRNGWVLRESDHHDRNLVRPDRRAGSKRQSGSLVKIHAENSARAILEADQEHFAPSESTLTDS